MKCVKTYNGSRWLGCSLRVEIAKEFYMDRLQQEWIDAAAAAAETLRSNGQQRLSRHVLGGLCGQQNRSVGWLCGQQNRSRAW